MDRILPTGKITTLRFVEFNRVEDGLIVETAMFVDLLHLMRQAGQFPLPSQTGADLEQRVVDLYRVQDGKLAENWISIDVLYYLAIQELDVLGRMQRIRDY